MMIYGVTRNVNKIHFSRRRETDFKGSFERDTVKKSQRTLRSLGDSHPERDGVGPVKG